MTHECEKECRHEDVKYCPHCKKVICGACGREWPEEGVGPIVPYIPIYPSPYVTYTSDCSGDWVDDVRTYYNNVN